MSGLSVVNTCIVTQRASYQSRQAIRRAIRENPEGTVAAVGCYAQVFPEELLDIKGLDIVAGNPVKARLPEFLGSFKKGLQPVVISGGLSVQAFSSVLPTSERTRGLLKIQDGCDSFCSYCIVPRARGRVRSLEPERVLSALMGMAEQGHKEVVLTGIHLGRYGADLKPPMGLKDLLFLVSRQNLPLRIRLSSVEPKELDKEIVEMAASEGWLCRHFHIPLQSGDSGILKSMNRQYNADEFRELIENIHARIPLAALGVDIMAGFPGEDEQAFLRTYRLVEDLPLSYFHVFPFSPRKGTPAWTFAEKVPEKEAGKRTEALRSLGEKKRRMFYESCLGREFEVLTEGWHERGKMVKGLSDNYVPIVLPSSRMLQNRMFRVRAERVEKRIVVGRLIND